MSESAEYMDTTEFRLALIGLMRDTFVSLIFAYEHFFVSCFRLKASDPEAQSIPVKEFRERANRTFGPTLTSDCWTGHDIRKYFEMRNSLAHQGGKVSTRLERWDSEINQLDGTIQITAAVNRELYAVIRAKTELLVDDLIQWKGVQS